MLLLAVAACTPNNRIVTNGEFHKLRPGMTYAQAVQATGAEGRRRGASERVIGALVPRGPDEVVYVWQNADGSNVSAAFQADRLTATAEWKL
jgi:hypothetical protein